MELLYVWIENYNNIHHQGFNFSPKHHFHFEPNKKEGPVTGGTLTHDPINPNYPDNFFGDHISNITAIVGKNGSGKSSLLYYLFYLNNLSKCKTKYLYIFKGQNRDQMQVYTNITINDLGENFESKDNPEVAVVYYNLNFTKAYKELHSIIDDKEELIFEKSTFIQTPDYKLYNLIKDDSTSTKKSENLVDDFLYNDVCDQIMTLTGSKVNNVQEVVNVDIPIPNIIELDFSIVPDLLCPIQEKLEELGFEIEPNKSILKCTIGESYGYNKEKLINFFSGIGKAKTEYQNPEFPFGIKCRWGGLSAGEESFLSLLIAVRDINPCYDNNIKSIIVLLDEPENNAHPEWQKKVLQYLTRYAASGPSIHFIVTTHSPIMLSDLPRENIIFLDKNASGECVVKEPKDMDRTFGANIHSLYRSSFFMDGVMGEFAKGKIDDVIADLKSKRKINAKRKAEIRYIIDMVGEDILRYALERMYVSKFKPSKREELELKKAEINRQLLELEKHDSNKN